MTSPAPPASARPCTTATTGLGSAPHPAEQRAQPQRRGLVLGQRQVGRGEQLVEVGAGAEVLARAAQHDDPHVGVEIGPLERRVQRLDQRRRSARCACPAGRA